MGGSFDQWFEKGVENSAKEDEGGGDGHLLFGEFFCVGAEDVLKCFERCFVVAAKINDVLVRAYGHHEAGDVRSEEGMEFFEFVGGTEAD